MIPYFEQPHLSLGPITIHGFGVLVALAVLIGAAIIRRRAAAHGLHAVVAQKLTSWILVGGFLGAHLVDRFVYFPGETLADPASILRVWSGISSFGGFLGAIAAIALFQRRHAVPALWPYLDVVAYAFPFGWIIGRLGCFVAFDHPGSATSFFLGQRDGERIVRHNLGLEEALYTVLIAIVFGALGRRRRPAGFFVGWLAVLYAPFRFVLDFLRKIDVRYLGLTPGQYGSILLLVAGALVIAHAHRSTEAKPNHA